MSLAAGSYVVEVEPARFAAELARLEAQVALFWPKERETLLRLDMPARAQILDLGCGPGAYLERLAEAFPDARLFGADANGAMIAAARARLGDRAALAEAAAQDLGTEPRFDLVVCRYLLQHLADPQAALARVRASLKPGGRVAVVEVDAELLGVSEPWNGGLAAIHRRAGARQARLGGDRRVARRLPRLLAAAGFSDVRLEAGVVHSDEAGLAAFDHQLSAASLDDALAEGAIAPAEHAFAAAEHRRFRRTPGAFAMSLFFFASGRRS